MSVQIRSSRESLRPPLPKRHSIVIKFGPIPKAGSIGSRERYYGKTKKGEYLSEKEAVQKGYRPANGSAE
jgi:hypothetical protein